MYRRVLVEVDVEALVDEPCHRHDWLFHVAHVEGDDDGLILLVDELDPPVPVDVDILVGDCSKSWSAVLVKMLKGKLLCKPVWANVLLHRCRA